MTVRRSVRYSRAFKLEVVESLESGRFGSLQEAQRHFGIGGSSTIRRWLLAYGKNHLIPKVVRVEKPNEPEQLAQLRARVEELEQALGRTHAENLLNAEFLRLLCDKYGEDPSSFKKKVGTRRCTTSPAANGEQAGRNRPGPRQGRSNQQAAGSDKGRLPGE